MNTLRNLVATAALIAVTACLPAGTALAAKKSTGSWGQLSAEWWQWVLAIPPSANPLLDATGDDCMVGQHGSTWFLAGSWLPAGPVTRDCDVPQTATLFFPVINMINFDTPGQCEQEPAPLPSSHYRGLSRAYIDGATNLSATLDGKPVVPPMKRTVSPVFEVALPDDNIFVGACSPDLAGDIYSPAVDDGYYVRINPLPVGAHTLHIHAEDASGGALDLTYNLNVVPVTTK
jgi:hypothetical protein